MREENAALKRQQSIRRRQVLMSVAVYLSALVPLAYIDHLGMVELTPDQKMFSVIAALMTCGLFYGLIRFDINLHFRDPSMTFAQVFAANCWSLVVAWVVAQPARPLAMTWYLLAFLFGFYTLKRWQFMLLAAFALAGYLSIVAREKVLGTPATFQVELLHWLILAAGLFWMSLVGGYVSMLRARLAEQRRELAEVAFIDPLTGVYNRRYLLDVLEREVARIRRGSVASLSIAMIDLDHFKAVNDRYGHLMGDRLLHRIGALLMDEMRGMDAVGRFGGEEFIIVMPDTPESGAMIGMDRVRQRIERDDKAFQGVNLSATLSIGVAELQHNETVQALLGRADAAMYAAKQAGRNRVIAASRLDRNRRVVRIKPASGDEAG